MTFCHECGEKFEEEVKFCGNCGAGLAGGSSSSSGDNYQYDAAPAKGKTPSGGYNDLDSYNKSSNYRGSGASYTPDGPPSNYRQTGSPRGSPKQYSGQQSPQYRESGEYYRNQAYDEHQAYDEYSSYGAVSRKPVVGKRRAVRRKRQPKPRRRRVVNDYKTPQLQLVVVLTWIFAIIYLIGGIFTLQFGGVGIILVFMGIGAMFIANGLDNFSDTARIFHLIYSFVIFFGVLIVFTEAGGEAFILVLLPMLYSGFSIFALLMHQDTVDLFQYDGYGPRYRSHYDYY